MDRVQALESATLKARASSLEGVVNTVVAEQGKEANEKEDAKRNEEEKNINKSIDEMLSHFNAEMEDTRTRVGRDIQDFNDQVAKILERSSTSSTV